VKRVLSICCLLSATLARGQPFPALNFTHITSLDGLSSDMTRCVAEDHQGFIWIGTYNGLNRYDGYRFKQYFHDEKDLNSLPGNEIQDIHCDRQGRLWITTSLGISCFLPDSNRWYTYSAREPGPRRLRAVADHPLVYETAEGEMWIMANADEWYRVGSDMNLIPLSFHGYGGIYRDPGKGLWSFQFNRLFHLDPGTAKARDTLDFSKELGGHYITYLNESEEGRYWLTAWGRGLWQFDPGQKTIKAMPGLNVGIFRQPIPWTKDGKKWLVIPEENTGLYLMDPVDLRYRKYFGQSLWGWLFTSAFVDHTGALWVCSDQGINLIPSGRKILDVYPLPSVGGLNGLAFGFGEMDSTWLVNVRGVGTYVVAPSDFHPLAWYRTLFPWGGNSPNPTCSFYATCVVGGERYFSTDSGLVVHGAGGTHCYFPVNYGIDADCRNILPVGDHTLWVRTSTHGLLVFDIRKRAFVRWYSNRGILPQNLNWLMRTRSGRIYLTANDGILLEYDSAGDRFLRHALPVGNLYGMAEDADGSLWICSRSGVCRYQPATGTMDRFYSAGGQMGETLRIAFDDFHNAWVNGYSGIWCYERAGDRWVRFGTRDGLPSGNYEGFLSIDPQGNILCGMQNAVIRFYPSKVTAGIRDKPAVITEAMAGSRDVAFPLNNHSPKRLLLQPGENTVNIDFAVLHYQDVSPDQYYYRLEPLMGGFERIANGHLNISGLSPGNYRLAVRGGDKFGNMYTSSDTLSLVVLPHYYQTAWFRALGLLVFAAVVGGVAWMIIRNIRKEANLRQKIARSEMQALRAQMNPHFIFNCLNSIDNLIQDDQKEKATRYLAKFARLIRAILENSKKETTPCWKDLEALRLYLDMEALRLDKQFRYHLDVEEKLLQGDYKVPPMILQPFVENAIHHGLLNKLDGDKRLHIGAALVDGCIRYSVEDNGVGREKAAAYKQLNKPGHQSMGLAITSERIAHFNDGKKNGLLIRDLYTDSGEPRGTRVEIWLNYKNEL